MSGTHSVTVDLLGNMAFHAITDTGHEVRMDAALEVGGTDTGPRPMELLLVGLGGCTGMDVISMLRKMRQNVTADEVHGAARRARALEPPVGPARHHAGVVSIPPPLWGTPPP